MKQINLVQLGVGTVGGAVVEQIVANNQQWQRDLGLDLRLVAVAGKDGAIATTSKGGHSRASLLEAVAARRSGASLRDAMRAQSATPIAETVAALAAVAPTIVLDAAAGSDTADALIAALKADGGAVLSNKAPLALPMSDPRAVALWGASHLGGRLRYETTCGAGLPVISTLQTLLATGDRVIDIQGALSGTLGAIFSMLAAGTPFSDAVRKAKDLGYTEPDPRDDLSGLDVARKALILARTMGRAVDLTDITVEGLVPQHLASVSIPEFLDRIGDADREIAARAASAKAKNASLKFVATVPADAPISVGMREVPATGVLGALQGPENIVSFRTERYDAYPLTVAGPGAGAAVTAAGMVGDALALAMAMV